MGLKEKMDQVSEVMRRTKEEWVETGTENTDLAIYLHFFRGDSLVAAVQCPLDRDKGLLAGRMGAMGFNADTMSITFESYHSSLRESPITGNRWMPREMQFVFENYPEAAEQNWVNECLTITMHERGGEFALYSTPYRIKDGKVEWQEGGQYELRSGEEGSSGGGVMFDYLQDSMTGPTILTKLDEQSEVEPVVALMSSLITDEEARLYHADVATFQAMGERELATAVVLSAEPGSNREKWLTERFGPPGTPYPTTKA